MTHHSIPEGHPFGHLIALRPAAGTAEPSWVCRCACGRELAVRTGHLISGNSRSCGCRRHDATSGVRHHSARLTPDLVRLARRLAAEGFSLAEIGDHLPVRVDKSTLSLAITRKTWKSVD